jgi:cyclophilin family peptidyl-prolyl cis-trans isomerase
MITRKVLSASTSDKKLGKLSGLRRRLGSQRAMTEALEGRRLFAVSVVQALAPITLGGGTASTKAFLAGTFGTDNVGGSVRPYSGSVVEMLINRNDGSGAVTNTLDIELDDMQLANRSSAGETVTNFLYYVKNKSYDSTVFHRSLNFTNNSLPAQFLQGGGFTSDTSGIINNVVTASPIKLDFQNDRPNTSGTIAMARTSARDSATSGFFFNTIDNSSIFNAGNPYAVFGQVIGTGQQTLTDLSSLRRIDASVPYGSASTKQTFSGFPVSNYPSGTTPAASNYVTIGSAVLKDQLSYQITTTSSLIYPTISADGVLTIARSGSATGTAELTVTAIDLTGARNSYTVQVNVTAPKLGVAINSVAKTVGQASTDLGTALQKSTLTAVLGLSNTGNQALTISGIDLPDGYSVVGTTPTSVAAGGTTNVTIAVNTQVAGVKSGQITVRSDDPTNPTFRVQVLATVQELPGIRVVVNGTKVEAVSPATSNLGSTAVGVAKSQTLTLSNTGEASMAVSSIDVPAGFTLSATLPLDIPGKGSVDLVLAVDTATTGTKSGTLIVHSTDPNNPLFSVPLTAAVYQSTVLNNKTVKSIIFTEADGTVGTLTLSGAGSLEAQFTGTNVVTKLSKGVLTVVTKGVALQSLALSGTNSKTDVKLKAAGKNKQVALGGITLTGTKPAVGTLDLAPAVLTLGEITLGGTVGTLAVAGLDQTSLTIGTSAASSARPRVLLDLGTIKNSLVDVLTNGIITVKAASLDRSDFLSSVRLNSVTVSGAVNSSRVEAGTSLGPVSANKIINSKIFAGTLYAGLDGSATAPANQNELGKGSISSVTVQGKAASFSGSVIAAAKLGDLNLGTLNAQTSSTIIGNLISTFAGKVSGKSFALSAINDDKSLTAALKSAKVTLPSSLTVTVY